MKQIISERVSGNESVLRAGNSGRSIVPPVDFVSQKFHFNK